MNGFIRKCLISMFVMMLILAGTTFLSTKNNEVQAADASEYTTEPYTHEQIQTYKTNNAKPIKAGGDWIFAGWFTDTTCTTAYNVNTHTQDGYAKFVPADVLSVKCQVNEGLQQGDDYTNLRIVSTVDNLKYSQVGFDISIGDKDYPYVSKNVASKIEARESGVEYGYSPNIFDLDSSHFITVTITDIPQSAFDAEIRVNPYWVTKDGTKVYGVSRYFKISDSYNSIINVPVRYYSGLDEAAEAITVKYPGEMVYSEMITGDAFASVDVTAADGMLTLTPSGKSLVADGVYGYLRFSLATDVTLDNLPTTNNFTVTKGTETSTITYKNYLTKYNGSNADTSWYDDDKDEFVIVSQTELYGLSVLSNTNEKTFSGDTIYLGGDVVANTGDVKGGTATDAKQWTPIGPKECWFAGTLDGQGHSISGIYYSRNQTNVGLFSRVSGTVQNLSLINSRFVLNAESGSVVAYLEGDIYNVSSDAYIEGGNNLGGIVGCIGNQSTVSATSEMINCMFTGTISSTGMHVGGMVGRVQGASSTVTAEVIIKNCLNSGNLTTTCAGDPSNARVGGMVGCVNNTNCSLDISYSMNTGELSRTSTGAGKNVYSLVGYKNGDVVKIDSQSTYAIQQTFTESGDGLHAGNVCEEETLTGLLAYKTVASEFFNDSEKEGLNDGIWVARYNDTPALRYFTDSYLYEPDQTVLTNTTKETIDDTEYTVYTIKDVADLYAITMQSIDATEGVNNTFEDCIIRLDADITINTSNSSIWGTKAPRYQWNPIGVNGATLTYFNGIFDGNGHTISGLYTDTVYNMTGLFGRTNASSKISDFKLENSYITSTKNYVGSVAGYNSGTIEKIYSNATIVSTGTTGYIGGITGEAGSTQTISECWFDGSVTAAGNAIGGIVGFKQGTHALTLENCLNTGSVVGAENVGGMLGHSSRAGSVYLEDCLNMATVTGTNSGHLVGRITGETTFTADAVYGVDVRGTLNACGQSYSAANEVNNNVFKKKTTAQLTGLLANKNTTLQFDNLDTETENDGAWIARKNDTPALRHFVNKGLYVPDTTVLNNTTTETIEGTTYTVYTVKDAGDLYAISMHSMENNFANSIIRLENDIVINTGNVENWKTDAPEYQWNSIGANGSSTKDFSGIFDGNMKTISGVYLVEDANNRGLIASTSATSIVQNVCLTNSYLKNSKPILGSIVGRANSGKFYNLYSDAIVESSDNNVGGILGLVNGSNYNIDMNNCWFAGSVVGQKEVGGIIGRISGTATVSNCLNTGDITSIASGTKIYLGGLFGSKGDSAGTSATVKNCLNVGEVYYPAKTGTTGYGSVMGCADATFNASATYTITQANVGVVNNASKSGITQVGSESNITGTTALTKMPDLFKYQNENSEYVNYWAITSDGAPVLESFADIADKTCMGVDLSWYNSGTNYTLSNAADFYGFTLMSQTTNFSGKTITLGDHITINAGSPYGADGEKDAADEANPDDWSKVAPDFGWLSIGAGKQFAGRFDGNMKTISGVYLSEAANYRGLFARTTSGAVIQNVKLINSYFKNTLPALGSIVGRAEGGEFYNIYSNAIVDSTDIQVGGIMGMVNGGCSITMNNCWSAGPVTGKTEVGGIIGRISGTATVSNCLNSGDITSIASGTKIYLGGLFGSKGDNAGTSATVKNCLNVGQVYYPAKTGTTGYGSVMGCADGTFNPSATYTITQENIGVSNNALQDGITQVGSKSDITGAAAISKMPELFQYQNENGEYENYWAITSDGAPILESFEDVAKTTCMAVDLSWYDDSNNYKLSDAEDLYGFSVLSIGNNFENATITLEEDVIINEGDSKTWGTKAPKHQWNPIGLVDNSIYKEFAGVFNGDGHSISGLYVNTAYNRAGLFGEVASSGQIENLKLENSYITSTKGNVGSIAGIGAGKFYMLYSDAILDVQSGYIGGLVGRTTGDVVLENCWYAGKITNTANDKANRGTGGLVGIVEKGSLTLLNGLNTGIINVKAYEHDQDSTDKVNIMVAAGGLIGQLKDNVTATIGACLHVGDVQVSDVVTGGYGPLVGYSNTQHAANVYATYTTEEGLNTNVSRSLFTLIEDAETIKGNGAKDVMPLLGWEEDWKCVDEAYPQIIFSDTGYGEDYVGNDEMAEVLALKSLYANKTLYQGELHDHADNGGSSDGGKTLADWKTQMTSEGQTLNMDFAASLDHHQTWHINHDDWQKNLFLYGTEAATTITDIEGDFVGKGKLHYNMLFPTQEDLKTVVQNAEFKYDYNSNYDNESSGTGEDDAKEYGFDYPNFTKNTFGQLIENVKTNNGFFVIAHPKQYPVEGTFSNDVLDYVFKDANGKQLQYGFEVIYQSYDHGSTVHNYNAWTELLTKGARLWATAGTDQHADLSNKALTSVYADSSADADKGNIIPYLAKGNFVAGSVGIQMSVGDTAMGGSCDFTGKKLVVDVGELHSFVFDSAHKYRVDVFNENGRIYSQMISVDADTRIATNGKIVMPTKEYDLYRVEIYDVTAKTRIAIGNPIWNDK